MGNQPKRGGFWRFCMGPGLNISLSRTDFFSSDVIGWRLAKSARGLGAVQDASRRRSAGAWRDGIGWRVEPMSRAKWWAAGAPRSIAEGHLGGGDILRTVSNRGGCQTRAGFRAGCPKRPAGSRCHPRGRHPVKPLFIPGTGRREWLLVSKGGFAVHEGRAMAKVSVPRNSRGRKNSLIGGASAFKCVGRLCLKT